MYGAKMPNGSGNSTSYPYDSHLASKPNGAWRADSSSSTSFPLPFRNVIGSTSMSSRLTAGLSRLRWTVTGFFPGSGRPARYTVMNSSAPLTNPQGASSAGVFVLLCLLWYTSSALSSNTGKSILNQFRFPITLTIIQFGFVAGYCLLFMSPAIRFTRLRSPTKAIIRNTLPMGAFQVGGHMFSSMAISRIPVSTVHTLKALSPLFTVGAYALLFGVSYSPKTYASLLPLTLGVMLACSFDVSASDAVGLLCAFGSAMVFVSSNIFFKKIMPSTGAHSQAGTSAHKLDKLNLLFYSSGMAFLLMIPIWMYYDLSPLMALNANPDHVAHPHKGHDAPHSVTYYFFMNGTVHFGQNIIAFIILSSTSPVTYSIASLIKRVVVILVSIAWFNQNVHPVQGFGILMTFTGLYMYNNAKGDVEKGENKMRRVEATMNLMLPVTKGDEKIMNGSSTDLAGMPSVPASGEATGAGFSSTTLSGRPRAPSMSQHNHHHANLTIKMPSANGLGNKVTSPTDSYPSPPPSRDSLDDQPPASSGSSMPLGLAHSRVVNGRAPMPTIHSPPPMQAVAS